MITKGRYFLMAIGFAVMIALLAPANLLALEFHPLVDDVNLDCSGATVGVVLQAERPGEVLSLFLILKGSPSTTRTLYYTCSSGPCHGTACGFSSVGEITTNAKGIGIAFKKYTNPYPGQGMHWDILATGNYYSGWFSPPFDSVGGPLPEDPSGFDEVGPHNSGDPTESAVIRPWPKKK